MSGPLIYYLPSKEPLMDLTKYQAGIYAINDTVAGQLVGGLYAHKHEAAAVRFFCDVAAGKESLVGKHPQDFDLIRLGFITHHNELAPDYALVLKGETWAAANGTELTKEH